jgi:hypothetical protein
LILDLIAWMIHIGSMVAKFVAFIANMPHFEYQQVPKPFSLFSSYFPFVSICSVFTSLCNQMDHHLLGHSVLSPIMTNMAPIGHIEKYGYEG